MAVCDAATWQWPEIFSFLQQKGNVSTYEMYRTFNCGVGMIVAVDAADADKTVEVLKAQGENACGLNLRGQSDTKSHSKGLLQIDALAASAANALVYSST